MAGARQAVAVVVAACLACCCLADRYVYLNYSAVASRIKELVAERPDLVAVHSAQSLFGLPAVGSCDGTPCVQWVVTLTNLTSHHLDPGRPEVLVSGEVHGDEVIGPHAVVAYVETVLRGVRQADPYFLRMVNQRVVTLLPMTNAVGYATGVRGEVQSSMSEAIDPNRDFAFDQDPTHCMRTVAARAINELFRGHLFRILITFHGGTNVLGYEWGDKTHCTGRICKPAPDEAFMHELGNRMAHYAGRAAGYSERYPVGTMGALVYPVHGGMEDWAYGASWSPEAVHCTPATLGGYPVDRTTYGSGTHRCATYLVETAHEKRPDEVELGDDTDVLSAGASGDGHVPRNVRLLVAAVDSAEPYVVVNATEPAGNVDVAISWHVGGAFGVDATHLQWSTLDGMAHGTSRVFKGTAGAPVTGVRPSIFSVDLPRVGSDAMYMRAAAMVDSDMARAPANAAPPVSPMTHLVGARTNSSWHYSNNGRVVQGHRVFYSDTVVASHGSDGKVVLRVDSDVTWSSEGRGPRAPSTTDVVGILEAHGGGTSYGPARGNATTPKSGEPGKHTTMDPRDQNGRVSGLIGIVALLGVTCLIVVYVARFYRKKRLADESSADEAEVEEPLRPNGDVEEVRPAVHVATEV